MRHRQWRFWAHGMCGAAALAATGCFGGDQLPRQPVSGMVSLNGRLLPSGVITFYPATAFIEGDMVVGGDMIKNGRFSIPRQYGLIPGTYKVGVYSGRQKSEPRDGDQNPGTGGDVPKELIPTKYNSDTKLEVVIEDHAIKEMTVDLLSN